MVISRDSLADVTWQENAQRVAQGIRLRVLEHVLKNNGGYLSQACSAAEIFATLYTRVMNLGPSQAPAVPPPFSGVPGPSSPHPTRGAAYNGPKAPHLDRFFISPGHYALVEYSALIEAGRMASDALDKFNQDGSTVEMIGADHSPGFEGMAGSLAQTISQAAGTALARQMRGETGRVWVFVSDGEMQEGQNWEALEGLSHYKLDRVGIYIDVNGHQCDGRTVDVLNLEPLARRLEAFGIRVAQVDGHDVEALAEPAGWEPDGRPLAVLAYTNPWQGIELLKHRAPFYHYLRFKSDQERQAYQSHYEQLCAQHAAGRESTRGNR